MKKKKREVELESELYIRVRSTDLNIVTTGGDEDLNQCSETRRVDPVIVGDHQRWLIARAFHFCPRNLVSSDRERYAFLGTKPANVALDAWEGTNEGVLRTQNNLIFGPLC